MIRFLLMAVLSAWALAPAAAASLVGDTDVPFSAERVLTTGNKSYEGHVYAAPGMQRHEQVLDGLPLVAILRADRQVAWVILPGLHIYAEFAFPKAVTDYDRVEALGSSLGSERVAGLDSERYRLEHQGSDGSALDGFLWMTGEGIVTKLDGTYTSPKNKVTTAHLELHDIKRGPQDPALFELPPGAKKIPIDMVQGLLSLQKPKH
jgi:hypothetical protein